MKRSKFSESQIVTILKEAEGDVSLDDLIRQHGLSKVLHLGSPKYVFRFKHVGNIHSHFASQVDSLHSLLCILNNPSYSNTPDSSPHFLSATPFQAGHPARRHPSHHIRLFPVP